MTLSLDCMTKRLKRLHLLNKYLKKKKKKNKKKIAELFLFSKSELIDSSKQYFSFSEIVLFFSAKKRKRGYSDYDNITLK